MINIFGAYLLLSTIFIALAIINSYAMNEEQFYLTFIHMTTSKINKLILLNFIFAIFFGLGKMVLFLFFDSIKIAEQNMLLDKMKRKILDFALLLIVFRDENLDLKFLGNLFKNI